MDVTDLTHLLIYTMIYLVLSVLADSQPCSSNITSDCPGNITVQVKFMNPENNCGTNGTVSCDTNLPLNLTCGFGWIIDQNRQDGMNQSIIVSKVVNQKKYNCTVLSPCGTNSSSGVQKCKEDVTIILLICGIGAILIIIVFGITMKIMLKRGEVQRQARRQQRQAMQSNDSTATTTTSYW